MGKRNELPFLQSLIVFNKWKTCVETGVSHGIGTVALGQAVEKIGGYIHGFDIWSRHGLKKQFNQFGSIEEVTARMEKAGLTRYTLTQIDLINEQNRFKNTLNELCPSGIDFAFIDSCHSYTGIRNDFSIIYPRLTKFGAIAFHDTAIIDGCREFILNLRTKYNDGTYDIVDFPLGFGHRRCGVSLLIKRAYPIGDRGIVEVCGSISSPLEIERKEVKWYNSEIYRNMGNMELINEKIDIVCNRFKNGRLKNEKRKKFDT